MAWATDGRTLFYTVEEESTKRQYRLYRHCLGEDAHDLVYEEADLGQRRRLPDAQPRLPRPRRLQPTTGEARFLPADAPRGEWRLVAPRVAEQEYDVDHHGAASTSG